MDNKNQLRQPMRGAATLAGGALLCALGCSLGTITAALGAGMTAAGSGWLEGAGMLLMVAGAAALVVKRRRRAQTKVDCAGGCCG